MDLDRVKRALFKHEGNVSKAARDLRVDSLELRRLCWAHHELVALALEHAHRLVDRAESKLREALDGDYPERSLRAATFILSHSSAARQRGWCRHSGRDGDIYSPPPAAAPLTVIWAGDAPGYRPSAPNVPEARLASASSGPATDNDRVH
jgi:hypothetical protein